MKITIDTSYIPHRIEVNDDCSLGEITEFLSRYYPDFTWKDVRMGPKPYYATTTGTSTRQAVYTPTYPTYPNTGVPSWITTTAGSSHVGTIVDDLIKDHK